MEVTTQGPQIALSSSAEKLRPSARRVYDKRLRKKPGVIMIAAWCVIPLVLAVGMVYALQALLLGP